jgi:hypothetical protein
LIVSDNTSPLPITTSSGVVEQAGKWEETRIQINDDGYKGVALAVVLSVMKNTCRQERDG